MSATDTTMASPDELRARLAAYLDEIDRLLDRIHYHGTMAMSAAQAYASAAQAVAAALAVLPDEPGRVWTRPAGNSSETAAFTLWLADQQDREDPVGDVAPEFIEGARRGLHDEHYATASEVRHAWEALDASPSRLDALDQAVAEWEAGR